MDSYNWQHLWYSSLSQTQTERADPRESQPHKGTSPPNPTTGGSRLFFSVPFSYCLFSFYLPRCTLPDFPSFSSLASQPFLSCCHHNNNNNNNILPIFLYSGLEIRHMHHIDFCFFSWQLSLFDCQLQVSCQSLRI